MARSNKNSSEKKTRVTKPEPRPPYALMFYQSRKAKVVVPSSFVPDSAKLKATILVPLPIEMECNEDPSKRHKATLLQFGRKCKCFRSFLYMSVTLFMDVKDNP